MGLSSLNIINNSTFASSYSAELLTILTKSHSDYHLKVRGTIYILTHKLPLCKQRKSLLDLNLISI